jgi:D-beta-D-heptose 7-phosphate kinase/D-beta-D-heptose 1-phosphate adenosyltransferase
MTVNLVEFVNKFAGLKVLVVGEAMLDSYLEGDTDRLCREAPVPIVAVNQRKDAPGGAANTAVNLCSLGADVTFLSVVGDDFEADLLRKALKHCGVSTRHLLVQPGRRTLAKHRVVAAGQILVRFDQGNTEEIEAATEQTLIEQLRYLFPGHDAIIISDYGYGIFTPQVIKSLEKLQRQHKRVVVADSKNLALYQKVGVTAVKPNYGEAMQLLRLPKVENSARVDEMAKHGERFLEITGAKIAAVTLDTDGGLVFERGKAPYRIYARPASNAKANGAGDTFVSTLALALAAKADTPSAAELAAAAAAIVITKDGTASCSADELREYFSAGTNKDLTNLSRLKTRLEFYRQQGKRIVFTNGCFDLLHPGHITFLNRAKSLGDVLIVGVNSDQSVAKLKGPSRPINTLSDRLEVLAALSCIDHLIAFEDTPEELIRVIRPDVFVKGGNYTRDTLPEAALVEELGGEVQLLPFLQDRSTTSIIEYIREGYAQQPAIAAKPATRKPKTRTEPRYTRPWTTSNDDDGAIEIA